MTTDERSEHGKALRAIARRLTVDQWEHAAQYAALQNHRTMIDLPYQTVLHNLAERGFAECTAWPVSKRRRGTPLTSNGKLYFAQPQGDKTSLAALVIARYVYLRSYAIGGGTPPFAAVFVVTGPRWVEIELSNATQLIAHKVGHPVRAAGVRKGKKYVAVRMDWI